MEVLHRYTNGNVNVVLFEDGSKERIYEGTPLVLHPESIDVKITNYCDAGCSFCHEKSTKAGEHGDLVQLRKVLSILPAGVEVALGGGNPLSHPDLLEFLYVLKLQGLVVNITINQKHLRPFKDMILSLIEHDLVKGVGISYSSTAYLPDIAPILKASPHVVFHMIMGINQVEDINVLQKLCQENDRDCKVLILGYKQFGFGINYYLKNDKIEGNKYRWFTQLATFFKKDGLTLSFDNLAIKQLRLERYFTKDAWKTFYMGDDFVFTMYIDGVLGNYAPSSTSSERTSFNQANLLDYFQQNKRAA